MTPPLIAILADDLTGAADTAAGMLAAGLPWVTWRRADGTVAWDDEDRIVAIDAHTRHLTAAEAGDGIRALATLFREAGVARIYKKVDSTLRGHVGAEVRAALEGWHRGSLAIVAPAFPAMGRTTIDGRQRLADAPLDCPSLTEMLGAAAVPATTVTLGAVRGGGLERAFRACAAAGHCAIVCDAVTDGDLTAIATAGALLGEQVVWVGSGGLARALFEAAERPPNQVPVSHVAGQGPVLVVAGSLAPVIDVQASRVAAAGAVPVTVSADELSDESSGLERRRDEIEGHLRRGDDVVVTIRRSAQAMMTPDPTVADRLGRMLEPCRAIIGGVVATGGDTAAALLEHWHVGGLHLIGEAETGVPVGIAIGSRPMIVALKAGGFGHDATLAVARAAVRSLLEWHATP